MGHFLTLACVHYRVTKDRTLLDAAIKVGDFLDKYFAKINLLNLLTLISTQPKLWDLWNYIVAQAKNDIWIVQTDS